MNDSNEDNMGASNRPHEAGQEVGQRHHVNRNCKRDWLGRSLHQMKDNKCTCDVVFLVF